MSPAESKKLLHNKPHNFCRRRILKPPLLVTNMSYQRSVSKLGFVDLEERHAPVAFGMRPASLFEVQAAGNELGIDIFFEPQYMWLAEEY